MVETFTFVDADTLRYTLTVDDPKTYSAPWTVAFPYIGTMITPSLSMPATKVTTLWIAV